MIIANFADVVSDLDLEFTKIEGRLSHRFLFTGDDERAPSYFVRKGQVYMMQPSARGWVYVPMPDGQLVSMIDSLLQCNMGLGS